MLRWYERVAIIVIAVLVVVIVAVVAAKLMAHALI
jgi:hypothetical protein